MPKKKPPRNKKVYARSAQHVAYKPAPPTAPADEVWRRIDDLLAEEPETAVNATSSEAPKRKRGAARRKRRLRRRIRTLDIIGSTVWLAIVVKLFIGDLDRIALASLAPQAVWILDLRWFLVLALAALLLLLFKSRTLGLGLAYVVGFPLVVIFWKLPKMLVKRRSPLLVIGIAGVVTSLADRAKLFIYAFVIASLSGLMIVLSHTAWLVAVGMVSMLIALVWWLTVVAIDSLRTTSFIRAQESVIKKVLGFEFIDMFIAPKHPNRVSLKDWTSEDAKAYRDSAGNSILVNRILEFWAYSLDQYRKGPSVVILNAVVVVGLLVQVVVVFAFLNYGTFVIDPTQFRFESQPDAWTFTYYSAAGVYFGEIGALAPAAAIATVVKLLNGFIGAVVVLTIVASIFLGYRGLRTDASSVSAIKLLRAKATEIEEMSGEQFQMDVTRLEEHLVATSWGLMGIAGWLNAQTPSDWRSIDKRSPSA